VDGFLAAGASTTRSIRRASRGCSMTGRGRGFAPPAALGAVVYFGARG
jgi:hypothetical protein